ncbi:carboxypeptidase-like regulatory domain-containing protein [Polaribacter butkevichii]|uniref:Carboxypeptidase regulatory-like domain-containing protein n=1 Tax=Polaribacter butkevichii TaxID=218490 RepID=A0A2P6CEL0_9FLAO|nr:carboxypeptidase-like regulatory domain-containing protein [Polaribacter butkevichii]PQJ73341.1 hypothetical protein BTO14_08730 [Polaribacter butkevichii]
MKHKFLSDFLILILLFLGTAVFSQQVLKGKVVDETGALLPEASVRVLKENKWTTTDFDGNFKIEYKDEKSIIRKSELFKCNYR